MIIDIFSPIFYITWCLRCHNTLTKINNFEPTFIRKELGQLFHMGSDSHYEKRLSTAVSDKLLIKLCG